MNNPSTKIINLDFAIGGLGRENIPSRLHLSRGTVYEITELNEGAIALDGAVRGPIVGSPDNGDRWSFDHHDGCIRLFTEATCQQVYRALRLGLDVRGRTLYVNDLDGDTLMSLFLLLAWDGNPKAKELADVVGVLDAHGPAGYVFMDVDQRRLVDDYYEGVVHPLVGPRPGGSQERFEEWDRLIERGLGLIQSLIDGTLEVPPRRDEPLKRLYQDGPRGLILAECDGFGGFTTLYQEGWKVVVLTTEVHATIPDLGSMSPIAEHRRPVTRRYTVGKLSDLVSYQVGPTGEGLLGRLQEAELKVHPKTGGWGGGSSIGGSPRNSDGTSSRLPPNVVWELMQQG